jgi:hypothetical protein
MKKFKDYIKEGVGRMDNSSTGMGADGLSKQRLKTLLYKETKKCTYNKLYKDTYWQGPSCIWDTFNKLNLAWNITGSAYKKYDKNADYLNDTKEWTFDIMWNSKEGGLGKHMKLSGIVTASGAGSVKDPLDKYDLNMVIF